MTIEIIGLVLGIGTPLLGWGIALTWKIILIYSDLHTLLKMHQHPEEHGFGTRHTNTIIEDNTRAMEMLTHYIKWLAKQQTGQVPPPPLGRKT